MNRKEQVAYGLGFIIVFIGAFSGRDFSNSNDVLEGVLMVALFLGVFLVLRYMNRRNLGDFEPYKIDG
jgi:hypothetical protein